MRFRRSAVPDQITGGVFAVYGAHVGVVRNHGPVTTYGVSDMVIDRSSRECPLGVCPVTRRRFPVGASPTRQPLQPEAIGAVMEVTKWLKPSISVSRIGGSASVQAATRVNAEQALYGAFSVNADFDRAPVIFLVGQQSSPRGSLPSGAKYRATTLYSVGP